MLTARKVEKQSVYISKHNDYSKSVTCNSGLPIKDEIIPTRWYTGKQDDGGKTPLSEKYQKRR